MFHKQRSVSIITLAFAGLFILLYNTGITKKLDYLFLDTFFRLRGETPQSQDIVIIAIDETFVKEYPFRIGELDRGFYAKSLENLTKAGVKAIGLDLFFPERSRVGTSATRDPDTELAEAIAKSKVVLPTLRNSDGSLLPAHPWLKDISLGVLTLEESAHELNPEVTWQGQTLSSFAQAIVQKAGLESKPKHYALIDYRGPSGHFMTLSFLDVYRNQFSYSRVKDKIALIGVTLKGTDRDQILTPFGEMSGVEVNANEVHTLLHGNLSRIPTWLYNLSLILLGIASPTLTQRKRGLWYALGLVAGITLLSFLLFQAGLFTSPLCLVLLPLIAYIQGSYHHLLQLDLQISSKLLHLLDGVMGRQDITQSNLARGFAPKGYAIYAPDMLESLVVGLNAKGGMMVLENILYRQGTIDPLLEHLFNQSIHTKQAQQQGTMPHHIAEPIFLDRQMIGSVALTLVAPPPPHLISLLHTSIQTFSQLARYQKLRDHTSTLTQTLWPWNSRSSLDKLDALSMVSDLLATERSWLGSLVESLPQAVFIMSPYGYSIYRNEAARRLFSEEKNMLAAIPESLRIEAASFQEDYSTLVERGQELELGLTERESGRPILLTLRVIRSDQGIKGVAGIISNLSKVEELDRQRQELIGMIVHDLRSPLTSIQGFAELMLSTPKDEYLQIIKSESERMRRMTDVFLDTLRLESNIKLVLSNHNLAELLRYAVASVSSQAAQKSTIFEVRAPAYAPIEADADLLSRLMINLFSNAIKYSAENKRIIVSLVTEDEHIKLSVQDQGYGISEDQQKHLFEKYQRGDNEKSRRLTGTGLGLYVVKLITDLHHGTIKVKSVIDQGTMFTVTLPIKQKAAS
jgi:signal transduction histidine kinase/CHASE2 domain-containing sensor protein